MSKKEIPLREARAQLGPLAERAHHGETFIITKNGRPYARLTPLETAMNTFTHTLTIVRGEQPNANGAEFGLAGVDVDAEVYAWFEANGVQDDDPDVWVLVTPVNEHVGQLANVIATRDV